MEAASVTPQQADPTADAIRRLGSPRQSAARTVANWFAYRLVRTVSRPLLFRDERFRQTDVIAALSCE